MMMNKTRDQKKIKIMIFGVDMLIWYNRLKFNDYLGPGAGEPGLWKM